MIRDRLHRRWRVVALLGLACALLAGMAGAENLPWLAADEDADAWQPYAATLNQRMATRSGPSTLYTEELGTLPQGTEIALYQQEMGSVPWGLVEFEQHGKLYRAYTGMKRIDTYADIPWAIEEPTEATVAITTVPLYGPGDGYADMAHTLPFGLLVTVHGEDAGYALVDYLVPDASGLRARGWVPVEALAGYVKPAR